MDLNDPTPASEVRFPRVRVRANGADLPGVVEATVTSNSYYQSDRFSVSLALNAPGAHDLKWWGEQGKVEIDMQFGLADGAGAEPAWVSLLVGEVDRITTRPFLDKLDIEGRDLTARLIEAKTQETFANKTSSEVATALAGRHGLTPVVDATTTLTGRFYQADHDKLTQAQFSRTTTEWDLLTYLAQQEGFDVFVKGRELHFQKATDPNADPFVVRVDLTGSYTTSNVVDLEMDRALTLAKDIEVVVRSWHSGKARGFQKTARAIGAKSAAQAKSSNQTGTNTQRFVFERPNMTEDEAQKFANSMLADLSKHERVIHFSIPAETDLTPRNMVRLEGTGSSWDQVYFIAQITRRLSWDGGFRADFELKNHSPQSQATVG